MTAISALTFLGAIFLFGVSPGPGIAVLLARSLAKGAHACWALALGMVLSDLLYLLLAIFGLAAAIQQWQQVFMLIQWLGGGYLIYLGIGLWRSAAVPVAAQKTDNAGPWKDLAQGFMISASNPKVVLFYLAFLPAFMDLSTLQTQDILLVVFLAFVGLLSGVMSVSFLADKLKRIFNSPKGLRGINRTAGVILIAAGLFLWLR